MASPLPLLLLLGTGAGLVALALERKPRKQPTTLDPRHAELVNDLDHWATQNGLSIMAFDHYDPKQGCSREAIIHEGSQAGQCLPVDLLISLDDGAWYETRPDRVCRPASAQRAAFTTWRGAPAVQGYDHHKHAYEQQALRWARQRGLRLIFVSPDFRDQGQCFTRDVMGDVDVIVRRGDYTWFRPNPVPPTEKCVTGIDLEREFKAWQKGKKP